MFYRIGVGFTCFFVQTESLSIKDLVKDYFVDVFVRKDVLTDEKIDKTKLAAFTFLTEKSSKPDCDVITAGG